MIKKIARLCASWVRCLFIFNYDIIPPSFYGTLAVTSGIVIQKFQTSLAFGTIFTLCLFVFFILTHLYTFSSHAKTVFLLVIILFFSASWRYHTCLHKHENFFDTTKNSTYTVLATIIDKKNHDHPYYTEVSRMRVFFLYKNCLATLLPICPFDIFVYSTQTSLLPGDLITLSSVHFKKPISVSFYQYLMKENIYATVFTSTVHAHLLLRPSFSFYRSYHGMYTHLHETLFAKLNPTTSPYFSLLFLGEKKDMHANFLFQKWGIAHYAARSGLHLTIFIFIWEFLLSIIPIPYFLKQLFLLLLCCVYAFLSKNATSFLRAFVLFLLGKFYATQKITTYFLHLLSVVCCIFLLYNPFLLFCLDFQLSFVLTYALVWISLIHITA